MNVFGLAAPLNSAVCDILKGIPTGRVRLHHMFSRGAHESPKLSARSSGRPNANTHQSRRHVAAVDANTEGVLRMSTQALAEVGNDKLAPIGYGESGNVEDQHRRRSKGLLVQTGKALFWEGDAQAHKIEILEGVVRAVRLLENGNRQILAFFWPGDVVMPTQSGCQQFTVEAVTNCRVHLSTVSSTCHSSEPCGVRQVLAETLSLVTNMSQKTSAARIAGFLLRIRKHLPEDANRPCALRLLISRADIADHLGTSLETVCRTLAEFKLRKFIDLPNRKTIRFINLPGLRQVAGD